MLFANANYFFGQNHEDSILTENNVIEKKNKFLLALDARRSFVLDKKTKFNGLKIGAVVSEKYKIGLGLYWMERPIILRDIKLNKEQYPDASDTVKFNFNYTSIFYEPIWYKNKRWELSTPLHLGIGAIRLSYRDTSNTKDVEFLKGGTPLAGISAAAEFKIWRWLAIGSGAGYRFILLNDSKVRKSVSAPIYSFSLKILAGELFKMTFRRKKLKEWQ